MKTRLILICILASLQQASLAIFTFDSNIFDQSILEPPQVINPKLNKTVNFSFQNTDLSRILLMLAKEGDFNVILPDRYNQKLSLTLTNQRIIDALDDISYLTGLQYYFRGNSLVFSDLDIKGTKFISVPIVYYSAENMADILNDTLLSQSLENLNIKPHASAEPGHNTVIVYGTSSEIKAAQKLISELDRSPEVRLYTPAFLDLDSAKKLVNNFLGRDTNLTLKRYELNGLFMKGTAEEVKAAYELIKKYDREPQPVSLVLEVYALKPGHEEIFGAVNTIISEDKLMNLNTTITSSTEFQNIMKNFEKVYETKFTAVNNQTSSIAGLDIEAAQNLIDKDLYTLRILEEYLPAVSSTDRVVRFISKVELKYHKDLKKLINDPRDLIILLGRQP